ncbi:MAG: hypothetical protein QOI85_2390 [Chloroflexota bacterium]|nr:hypothetical protein [Chloroflexota bacterium]
MLSPAEVVNHVTVGERKARGKAARRELPRAEHAAWVPPPDRGDPVELLEKQATTRVPELVPIRYGRMLVSPFTFYRGAAYLMASDLASVPRTALDVQLCGDAHLSNFGVYAAPARRLVFDLNDFDETLPGPFEWDLKRLVASFAVAGRDRGFAPEQRASVNRTVSSAYRETMRGYAEMRNLDVWYSRVNVDDVVQRVVAVASAKQLSRFEKNLAKARSKDSLRAFEKLTQLVDGELRIVSDPPVIVPIRELVSAEHHEALDDALRVVMRAYRGTLSEDRRRLLERFRHVDAARKVVGVGSVGTRAWIMLLLGRDDQDPLILQFKEAEASVLEPFLGESAFENHGQRVVEGQRMTQGASDMMLGWLRTSGVDGVERDYYVRQLWDGKGSALVELMNPKALAFYADLCGRTLARAHARSGDPVAISSYLGKGDDMDVALARFAEAYADQNDRDYATMHGAVDDGRVVAETGV